MDDMDAKGRRINLKGEETPTAILKDTDVARIRKLHATGKFSSYAALGRFFGLSGPHVSAIVRRVAWKHVP
jgi:hypothetical protein